MERRKGIAKMSTGKRTVKAEETDDGGDLLRAAVTVPQPIKPFIPKPRPTSTVTSAFQSAPATLPADAQVQEYNVRVPKLSTRPHNLMRFNGALNVDFSKWVNVRMQREDNSHLYKPFEFVQAEMPKFGAGSEFGRDQREEARRRKYGMHKRRYKKENQPWMLKAGTGETSRKFKGLREGGVNENASYFIFTQSQDGCFEVFPIKEWYNFTPVQRYKALSAEEAEEQFSKRSKIMNLFSVMVQKRIREDKDEIEEEKSEKVSKGKKQSDMQLTDMDDWVVEEMDEDDDSEEGGDEDGDKAKKAKKKPGKKAEKEKKDSDDDLDMEDSDDGDEEGREQDYMTDVSSESEDEEMKKPDLPGIDQDENLHGMLESGSSSEEETKEKKEEPEEENEESKSENKKKSKKKKKGDKKAALPDAPTLMDESSPPEDTIDSKAEPLDVKVKVEPPPVTEDGAATKRKAPADLIGSGPSKKPKVDLPSSILQLAASEGITEDAVKKYLLRKPMTIAELLQKFKPKKSKISSTDMVPIIAHILKQLNPAKRTVSNKTYFFINKSP